MANKAKSLYVLNALKRLSQAHLHDFNTLANSQEFDSLKEAVINIQHNTRLNYFNLDHTREASYLAQESSFCKGVIFGLSTLIRIIEASPEEVDRRESKSKRKSSK